MVGMVSGERVSGIRYPAGSDSKKGFWTVARCCAGYTRRATGGRASLPVVGLVAAARALLTAASGRVMASCERRLVRLDGCAMLVVQIVNV
jgi:hypothetical protein